MLGQLGYDVRHALRGLLRDRAFTLVAVLSIGLGAGANSAIFSLVGQAVLRQLPVKEPGRLVLLNWNGAFIGKGSGRGEAVWLIVREAAIMVAAGLAVALKASGELEEAAREFRTAQRLDPKLQTPRQ